MSDYFKYRLLEIWPAFLVWTTLVLSVVLSFIRPIWVMYFIIVFDVFWLLRVMYFIIYVVVSSRRLHETSKIDWLQKLHKEIPAHIWGSKVHLIFLPTYKESLSVIKTTLDKLLNSNYPVEKFIIVLCGEARDKENFLANSAAVKEEYKDKFMHLVVTMHPADSVGEIAGKGSNLHYAGLIVQQMIDNWGIPYEDVIVSSFDIDTCVHENYFAYLTYLYCTVPNPLRASYQPVALYNNNMWESNPFLRVASFGTTFWIMTELERPERLLTFSSHSMSFKALVDVGFWQKNIVTEDSRIFLQCFLRYGGDYRVVPMHLPVSMATAKGDGLWDSAKNLYKQQRRWAWGVEHFPFMVWHFRKHKHIPWAKKIKYLFNQGEGMYSWAVAPLLIFILGRLPLLVAPEAVKATAFYQNVPFTLETIINLSMSGMFVSAFFSLFLLPKPPQKHPMNYPIMLLQWILLPVVLVVFGVFPAIDAQTRLMFGKYLGFYVSKKKQS